MLNCLETRLVRAEDADKRTPNRGRRRWNILNVVIIRVRVNLRAAATCSAFPSRARLECVLLTVRCVLLRACK